MSVTELCFSVMQKSPLYLLCSCFISFNGNTFCFLTSRYLLQFSLPWNMVVLDCQKKQLCSVMDQIILRYENVFNFILGVRVALWKERSFTVVSDKIFGSQNTILAVRELVSLSHPWKEMLCYFHSLIKKPVSIWLGKLWKYKAQCSCPLSYWFCLLCFRNVVYTSKICSRTVIWMASAI